MDKDSLVKLIDSLRRSIKDIEKNLANLKMNSPKVLTRTEVAAMIKDALTRTTSQWTTSVGTVRCIACGREGPTMEGAMTEADATKILGEPPSSIVHGAGTGGFNVTLGQLDPPRSARSARASCRVVRRQRSDSIDHCYPPT